MCNRAIIKPEGKNIGVYLHWNGGIDSVTEFLKYCELKRFRSFDDAYGMARFCQVVGNFFGGTLSIGIEEYVTENDDMYLDNGIYIVKGWNIVRHVGNYEGHEGYDLDELLHYIDEKQPKKEQLGDFLYAVEMPISELKLGDLVFVEDIEGRYEKRRVIGFGDDKYVNGHHVLNVPYVDKWESGPDNINNYIFDKVRVLHEDL